MAYLHAGYDDIVIPAELASGLAALTSEQYRDTGYVKPFFRHDQDDTLYVTIQMPHRKRLGSALGDFHLHLVPMSAPGVTEYAYFRTTYAWVKAGDELPALASWSANVFTQFEVTSAKLHKSQRHTLISNIAAPAGETYSSMLLVRVTRLGSSGGGNDTYKTNKSVPPGTAQANLCLLSLDAHVLCDRQGSYTISGD